MGTNTQPSGFSSVAITVGGPTMPQQVRADLTRTTRRFQSKYRPGRSRGLFKGDSYPAGAGSAGGNTGFAQQIMSAFAQQFSWSNYGYAGRPISAYRFAPRIAGADIGSEMGLVQAASDDVAICLYGLNDLRGVSLTGGSAFACGSNPASKYTLMSRVQADATWMMIPETSRVRMKLPDNSAVNPAVTLTTNAGSWSTGAVSTNANVVNSNGVTNTAALTTTIGDLVVVRYLSNASSTGTWTLTIDGVNYGPFLNKAAYDGWVTDCVILKLPTVAPHSVVITHTSGDNLILDSVDCVDSSADFGGVLLYSGPAPLSPTGFAVAPTMNSARANASVTSTGASVSGTTLTVAAPVTGGQFAPGQVVSAQTANPGVLAAGTTIVEQLTKTGVNGEGTYRLSQAASVNGAFTSLSMSAAAVPFELEVAGRDRFASWIDEAMQGLYDLGFNTVRMDIFSGYNPTHFENSGDEVHMKDLGHSFVYLKIRPYILALTGK